MFYIVSLRDIIDLLISNYKYSILFSLSLSLEKYCAFQENGILYDITREDGLSFNAKSLDVKYHSVSTRRLNSQWIGL